MLGFTWPCSNATALTFPSTIFGSCGYSPPFFLRSSSTRLRTFWPSAPRRPLAMFSFRLAHKQAGFPFAAKWLPTAAMHAIFKEATTSSISRTAPPHGNSSNWFSINFFTILYSFLGFCNTLFLSKVASISFMMSISISTLKVTGNWKRKIQKIKNLIVNSSPFSCPYTLAR